MKFLYTARFLRSLKKLPKDVQDDVILAVERFEKNQKDTTLKVHKLHGVFKTYHAFSANYSHRIVIKISKTEIHYMDVGSHDVYK
jgi:mRNA-degrading endonuclease YafQ of YafQ-DinJ toxin-antitoxin module